MAINIKNPRAEQLARDLARETGESITNAMIRALDERLRLVRATSRAAVERVEVQRILSEYRRLPVRDARTPEQIVDDLYDESGLPR
jgi:antitoxin VapB